MTIELNHTNPERATDIFHDFLVVNKAYKKFVRKLVICNPHATTYKHELRRWVRSCYTFHSVISSAFPWAGTVEGEDYWRKLNKKWLNTLVTLKLMAPKARKTWEDLGF